MFRLFPQTSWCFLSLGYKNENMKHKHDKNNNGKELKVYTYKSISPSLNSLFFNETVFLPCWIIFLVVEEK